ncbi:MAG: hypothetical protein H7Z40_16555 [Phycisphaerae bacterium]|nr:hypothetical protein [Gemmatimonadaceae bacterium]
MSPRPWDATLLPARAKQITDRRIVVSHDEWMEMRSQIPIDFSLAEITHA